MTLRNRALKVATRDLVDSLAGFEAAATRCFVGKTQLERCANKDHQTSFLSLRDVVELERFAPRPLITMELCRQAGGVFLPLPDAIGDASGLPMRVMQLSQELGDVSRSVSEALADGAVQAAEQARIEAELDQLIECAVQARHEVRAMQGKGLDTGREEEG